MNSNPVDNRAKLKQEGRWSLATFRRGYRGKKVNVYMCSACKGLIRHGERMGVNDTKVKHVMCMDCFNTCFSDPLDEMKHECSYHGCTKEILLRFRYCPQHSGKRPRRNVDAMTLRVPGSFGSKSR